MKVKDILKLAVEFVGERQLLEKLQNQTDVQVQMDKDEQSKLDCFVRCFNLVNQEIASDYLPFLTKENVTIQGGIIAFDTLKKKIINVYEIKDRFGFNLPFKVVSNCVEVGEKVKSIVYSFLPEDIALEGEVEFFNGLSARIYAYGIASEFLLLNGLSADAEIWEERYKESLFILSRKRGEHQLPKRSWL